MARNKSSSVVLRPHQKQRNPIAKAPAPSAEPAEAKFAEELADLNDALRASKDHNQQQRESLRDMMRENIDLHQKLVEAAAQLLSLQACLIEISSAIERSKKSPPATPKKTVDNGGIAAVEAALGPLSKLPLPEFTR